MTSRLTEAYKLKPGQRVHLFGKHGTHKMPEITRIKPGRFKSYIHILFKGGRNYNVPRSNTAYIRENT